MDIVLELTDTFIADYIYAWAKPVLAAPYDFPVGSVANASARAISNSWTYEPASQYIYVEPSQSAYMSAWPRDNLYRQLITLFGIVWYVVDPNPF